MICNSKLQRYRRSSFGSYPAVAPQTRIFPPRFTHRSEGCHVSPPVKLITTSTPPSWLRRCGLPYFSTAHFEKSVSLTLSTSSAPSSLSLAILLGLEVQAITSAPSCFARITQPV